MHRVWGENFLAGYGDLDRYLAGRSYRQEALSIDGLLDFGRAPASLRPLVRAYVRALPRFLRRTGFNPWVMALITRTG